MFTNCCCRIKIGFDDSIELNHPLTPYFPGCSVTATRIINIALDVSRLGECKVVYAGLRPGAGARKTVIFDPADWAAVRSYIEGGGRLMLSGENALADATTEDSTTTNSFLTAIGSSMQWAGGSYEPNGIGVGCASYQAGLAGDANIAQLLPGNPFGDLGTDIFFALSGAVSGGTSVFIGRVSSQILFAVEQIGDGFLFFNADNAIYNGCNYSSCEFFDRLFTYADADII